MGTVSTITADKFPKQSDLVGRAVRVVFNFDLTRKFPGICVRQDLEHPFRTILALDDGRYVDASECQYTW